MPGIVGVISAERRQECQGLVGAMVASMLHEPFYLSGTYTVPEMGVYGGWVAHEHSSAAAQPFVSDDGYVTLLLAGELFHDEKTQVMTQRDGCAVPETAPQLLIRLYQEKGERCFIELNGLFSGLLIDKRQRKAFLFIDRYGMERIYWHQTNEAFYFASEAKALLRVLPQLRQFDSEGVAEFLTFGCTLSLRTLFRGIEILPAASLWTFECLKCQKGKYFSPESWEKQSPLSPDVFDQRFREAFQRIVPRFTDSNSSAVGISLTAGLDSRMIMACLPENVAPVCHTFSGENKDTLDARIAARVAAACGLEHHVLRLGRDFLKDFPSHVDKTVYLTDGTLGPLGAHEIYFNRQARQLAPVRLTGVCGGEIMRGVSFFKPLHLSAKLVNSDLQGSINRIRQEHTARHLHPLTFTAFTELPRTRFGGVTASRSQLPFRTPYLDNEFVSLAFRVPESLREAASPGLRLIRSTKTRLANIPTDRGKLGADTTPAYYMRRLMGEVTFKLDYYGSEGFPRKVRRFDAVLRGITAGIGIGGLHKFLLYRRWFQEELSNYVADSLSSARANESEFWDSSFVAAMAMENGSGRQNYTREINAVLTLDAVKRLLFRNPPGRVGGAI